MLCCFKMKFKEALLLTAMSLVISFNLPSLMGPQEAQKRGQVKCQLLPKAKICASCYSLDPQKSYKISADVELFIFKSNKPSIFSCEEYMQLVDSSTLATMPATTQKLTQDKTPQIASLLRESTLEAVQELKKQHQIQSNTRELTAFFIDTLQSTAVSSLKLQETSIENPFVIWACSLGMVVAMSYAAYKFKTDPNYPLTLQFDIFFYFFFSQICLIIYAAESNQYCHSLGQLFFLCMCLSKIECSRKTMAVILVAFCWSIYSQINLLFLPLLVLIAVLKTSISSPKFTQSSRYMVVCCCLLLLGQLFVSLNSQLVSQTMIQQVVFSNGALILLLIRDPNMERFQEYSPTPAGGISLRGFEECDGEEDD